MWNLNADKDNWKLFETYAETEVKFSPTLPAEENAVKITNAIHKAAVDSITRIKRTPMEFPWWNFKLENMKKKL